MYRKFPVILNYLLVVAACSTPADRGVTSSIPTSNAQQNETPSAPSKLPNVKITTLAEIADALGVPSGYLSVAHVACGHHRICRTENGGEWFDRHQCQEELVTFWCEKNECRHDVFGAASENTCIDEVWARSCDDLDRPLQCKEFSDHEFTAHITDWPRGPVPKGPWKSIVDRNPM